MVETASAGAMARRTLLTIFAVLACGTLLAAIATPLLLDAFPIPTAAGQALAADPGEAQQVPGIAEFVLSLISPNLIAAAAENAMLPLVVFFALFGVAVAKLPERQSAQMKDFFAALGNVDADDRRLDPVARACRGVRAGDRGRGAGRGRGLPRARALYPDRREPRFRGVSCRLSGRDPARAKSPVAFARAVLPAQAVALSTQSSLASLPAMLASCRQLGIRETSADFVLPLAVAIFRATSPAMNLAVAIYVAKLTGVELTPATIAAGAAVALVTTIGSVSLPGTISFVASIGPIALAMGVPIGPLALLVAVEMLPDIMRTVGNVTMDVAVTASVDHAQSKE